MKLSTTIHADKKSVDKIKELVDLSEDTVETKVNYEEKARKYADERGLIFYELKGNIMTYEEQVKDSLTSYGIYVAEVNLDTNEIKQVKTK